ncbi:MAG: LPS export ABC transporter periplasmic protein LptC, partial [Mariprofundus sp.]
DGQQVLITSQQAWFDPLKRNVRFKTDVLVRHDVWTLSTDSMTYVSAADEMHIPDTFKAWSETVKARGKNMRLHRTNGQVTVDDGIWIEDSNPQWQGAKQ